MSEKVINFVRRFAAQPARQNYETEYTIAETEANWFVLVPVSYVSVAQGAIVKPQSDEPKDIGPVSIPFTLAAPMSKHRHSSRVAGRQVQGSDSPVDSSEHDYRDKWLDERFARVEFQYETLRDAQKELREDIRSAIDDIKQENRHLIRMVQAELQSHLDGLRQEISDLKAEMRSTRETNERGIEEARGHYQATVRWLIGVAVSVVGVVVAALAYLQGR